ncbi:MAG: sulfate permease, SulP family [Clostridiales bacterium]|nr:sulfate permease, SulP family [Clostridiales bacterium]
MNFYLKPKLFSTLKSYTKQQFMKDVTAGIIVAIIALPLSIALALASGVSPEKGLYTAIIAGFVISFFGGSRVQISGPTAAFATIVAGIVAKNGVDGLILATIMAGILVMLMGIFKMGNLIKYIPYTITTGFTSGIAITILIGQLKDFLGLTFTTSPIETVQKLKECIRSFSTINLQALLIGLISLAILILWPKINQKIPASLIAVFVGSALVKLFHLPVNTIGSLYVISNALPSFHIPEVSLEAIQRLFPDAITIALLAMIESLLSCVVSDGMIGSRHNSNMELVAQGLGNISSALFGGIPATGAIARTAANVKNGGRTPIAGMVHSIVLVLILVILTPYAALIPMPTIAAILFMVAYNMSEWRIFLNLLKTSPKSDIAVLITTFSLTVVFDLVVAIEVGILLTAILFIKRMADVADIQAWKYLDSYEEERDEENIHYKVVPKNTLVYELSGPMFFAAADIFMGIPTQKHINAIILRMRSVPAMDSTALHSLQKMKKRCDKNGITLIFSHVCEQPMAMMKKAGFSSLVGEDNFCPNIDAALARAKEIA